MGQCRGKGAEARAPPASFIPSACRISRIEAPINQPATAKGAGGGNRKRGLAIASAPSPARQIPARPSAGIKACATPLSGRRCFQPSLRTERHQQQQREEDRRKGQRRNRAAPPKSWCRSAHPAPADTAYRQRPQAQAATRKTLFSSSAVSRLTVSQRHAPPCSVGRAPGEQTQCAPPMAHKDQDHDEEAAGGIGGEGMHRSTAHRSAPKMCRSGDIEKPAMAKSKDQVRNAPLRSVAIALNAAAPWQSARASARRSPPDPRTRNRPSPVRNRPTTMPSAMPQVSAIQAISMKGRAARAQPSARQPAARRRHRRKDADSPT